MNSPSDARRRALRRVLGAGVLLSMQKWALAQVHGAHATIKTVANFDTTTWARLLAKGPRPAAYVFTNTFCATCPEAFEALHHGVQASGKSAALVAVVMDVQGANALVHARHYQGATQIYAFDGFAPEIRQTIDPQWRNVTPYTVLVGRNGGVQRVIGPPDAAHIKAWLG